MEELLERYARLLERVKKDWGYDDRQATALLAALARTATTDKEN